MFPLKAPRRGEFCSFSGRKEPWPKGGQPFCFDTCLKTSKKTHVFGFCEGWTEYVSHYNLPCFVRHCISNLLSGEENWTGEYGEPPLSKHSAVLFCFSKIRTITETVKSFFLFTLIRIFSFQFSQVYTETPKLLNSTVIGDSCLPRRVNFLIDNKGTSFTTFLFCQFTP